MWIFIINPDKRINYFTCLWLCSFEDKLTCEVNNINRCDKSFPFIFYFFISECERIVPRQLFFFKNMINSWSLEEDYFLPIIWHKRIFDVSWKMPQWTHFHFLHSVKWYLSYLYYLLMFLRLNQIYNKVKENLMNILD